MRKDYFQINVEGDNRLRYLYDNITGSSIKFQITALKNCFR